MSRGQDKQKAKPAKSPMDENFFEDLWMIKWMIVQMKCILSLVMRQPQFYETHCIATFKVTINMC